MFGHACADSALFAEVLDSLAHGNSVSGVEVPIVTRGGDPLVGLIFLEPVALHGMDLHILTTIDITERQAAEKALQEHREQLTETVRARTSQLEEANQDLNSFRRLAEAAGQGIGMAGLDGSVRYMNPTLMGYLGIDSLGQALNDRFFDHYPSWAAEKMRTEVLPAVMEHGQWKGELALRSRLGGELPTLENFYLVSDSQGAPLFIAAVITDMSERKALERSLLQAKDRAEAASVAKSDFVASMSHELRTPLNAVIGFSQMLREEYFGPLNAKQAEYVHDILGSGEHLLSLINDILDLSKVEAGKMELVPSALAMADLVESCLVMIREKAHTHSIEVSLEIDDQVASMVTMVDQRMLKQIMFNLLSNATKFTPDGGHITVGVTLPSPDRWLVFVQDDGVGIDEKDQGRIFETFEQVKGGAADKTPGTGLGLSLTQRFVQAHGGQITVQSAGPGQGSRFTFWIPVVPVTVQQEGG